MKRVPISWQVPHIVHAAVCKTGRWEQTVKRVFRLVDTARLSPIGTHTTKGFNLSVERNGVVTPIIVSETTSESDEPAFEIVDGNRRVRAAKFANISQIPAVVLMEASEDDRDRLTLISNHLRSSNFLTESNALSSLVSTGWEIRSMAFSLGIAPSKVQKIFDKLETMPADVRTAMCEGRIPVSSATAIAAWPKQVQGEVVALLRERHHVQTWAIRAIKERYDEAHPRLASPTRVQTVVAPAYEAWTNQAPVGFESANVDANRAQSSTGVEVAESVGSKQTASVIVGLPESTSERRPIASLSTVDDSELPDEPRAVDDIPEPRAADNSAVAESADSVQAAAPEDVEPTEPAKDVDTAPGGIEHTEQVMEVDAACRDSVSPNADANNDADPAEARASSETTAVGTTVDAAADKSRQLRVFVTSLDAGLLELASKTRDEQLGREVWIDRAMRAWDLAMAR